MKTLLLKCQACGSYTLKELCPSCGEATVMALPARYSPQDRYGHYRRRLRESQG